jgi:hypothetical protein
MTDPNDRYYEHYAEANQAALKVRYEIAHATILAGPYASLQRDIDSGRVWELGTGGTKYAMHALNLGAVLAPPTTQHTPEGAEVPAYWELGVGRGSVPQAEAWIAATQAAVDEAGKKEHS